MDVNFLLVRDFFGKPKNGKEGFTLGTLTCDGVAIGNTCEDEDRHLELDPKAKVYGKTAIPRGRYQITNSFSHRFGKVLPEILGVTTHTGVRCHGGNHAEQSEGCVLTGRIRLPDGVQGCDPVVQRIIGIIQRTEEAGGKCWIKIM